MDNIKRTHCPLCGSSLFVAYNTDFCCYNCNITGQISDIMAKTKDSPVYYEINAVAMTYFKRKLYKAQEYITKRNLISVKNFNFGYADGYLCKELVKKYSISDIIDVGLGVLNEKGELKDFFFNRLMFPIYDSSNRIIGFGGRALNNEVKPKYLNTKDSPIFKKKNVLYGLEEFKPNEESCFLVEGYMDTIALHKNNVNNSLGILGTAVTIGHIVQLKNLGITKVVICPDMDEPGIKSALRSISILKNHFEIEIITLPSGKDCDEYFINHTSAEFNALKRMTTMEFQIQNDKIDIKYLN